jgi:hypothetical protein
METRKSEWTESKNVYYCACGIPIEKEDFKGWKLRFQEAFSLLENN